MQVEFKKYESKKGTAIDIFLVWIRQNNKKVRFDKNVVQG